MTVTWDSLFKELEEEGGTMKPLREETAANAVRAVGENGGLSGGLPPTISSAALAQLYPEPDPYIGDPVGWVQGILGGYLWSKQVEIMEAVRDYRYVAVQSCHGPGKSFTASAVVAWWLACHKLGEAFAVTTAPSWPQVEAILWREIRRRYREGRLLGRITQDCIWKMNESGKQRDGDEEIIAMGRKPADYDETTFQGIHARYFLAVLDEAGGIPEKLWNSVLSLATNENSRILAIGNPDDPNSHFAQICKQWALTENAKVIKISAFDTPNFTGEEVPEEMKQDLVSPLWVNDRRLDWGEGSPIWISKVEGEFPDISDDYLFPPSLIAKCHATELAGLERGRYGLDVARYGTDKTVLYRNRGGHIRLIAEWVKQDTEETADKAGAVLARHGARPVPCMVDVIGVGAGVFDKLRRRKMEVAAYQGSERALNFKKFKNRRSESWWTFRELAENGAIDLDPNDTVLVAQLGSVKWGVDSAGRIYIETKEDLKERGLPSPDRADAAIMSTVVRGSVRQTGGANKVKSLTADLLTRRM